MTALGVGAGLVAVAALGVTIGYYGTMLAHRIMR